MRQEQSIHRVCYKEIESERERERESEREIDALFDVLPPQSTLVRGAGLIAQTPEFDQTRATPERSREWRG